MRNVKLLPAPVISFDARVFFRIAEMMLWKIFKLNNKHFKNAKKIIMTEDSKNKETLLNAFEEKLDKILSNVKNKKLHSLLKY